MAKLELNNLSVYVVSGALLNLIHEYDLKHKSANRKDNPYLKLYDRLKENTNSEWYKTKAVGSYRSYNGYDSSWHKDKATLEYSKEEARYVLRALQKATARAESNKRALTKEITDQAVKIRDGAKQIEEGKKILKFYKDEYDSYKVAQSEIGQLANTLVKTTHTIITSIKSPKLPSNATLNRMAKF